ncbi:MAG: glucose-6-phosphate isomerase [Leptospirillia bacterium]
MNDNTGYQNPEWAAAHRISIDSTRMMASCIKASHGITNKDIADLADTAGAAHDTLCRRRQAGELPFFDLPYQDTSGILALAESIRDRFDNFVLVGIGGSSLGPKATQQALSHPLYNLLGKAERGGGPRLFFLENVDPATVHATLSHLEPAQTCFNVVTKSGGTAETLANYMVARGWLEAAGCKPEEHLIATTDPTQGDLRKLADTEGWASLPVPPGVGGRFSQLTAVGLLPAAVCGIDIGELLAGAADMEARTRGGDLMDNPAYRVATLHYLADSHYGKPICVIMPYADALTGFADWFVQLWAESLGKALDLSGQSAHTGQTPLSAVGAVDQHSQLQLFVEGPHDKMVTFFRVADFGTAGEIPGCHPELASMNYLGGASLAQLLNAEQAATEAVLTEQRRPNMRIDLPKLNPFVLGQLFFLYEVATAFAGGLYGIDPFDQPGVEQGKVLTYGAMGREGYPNLLDDMQDPAQG